MANLYHSHLHLVVQVIGRMSLISLGEDDI
jgi:hypothetical protein